MATCHTTFDLPVQLCPNWSQLSWGNPTITLGGAGASGSFTPSNATGSTAIAIAAVTDGLFNAAIVTNSGTVNYNGIGCNINLHIVVVKVGTQVPSSQQNANLTVSILLPGNINFTIYQNLSIAAGTMDVPLVLPNTGGQSLPITVQLGVKAPSPGTPPGPQSINATVTITNTP